MSMPSGGGRRQWMQLIATEATRAPRRNAKYGRTARRAVSREDRCREVLQRPAHAHRMLPVDLLARKCDSRQLLDREAPGRPAQEGGDQPALHNARLTAHEKS